MSEEETKKLVHSINRLEKAVRRSYDLWWAILRGVFYSIGWIIGLAILATLTIYLLPKIPETNSVGRFIQAVINVMQKK